MYLLSILKIEYENINKLNDRKVRNEVYCSHIRSQCARNKHYVRNNTIHKNNLFGKELGVTYRARLMRRLAKMINLYAILR